MLFNSLDFAIFLPIVFFLYWFVVNKNLSQQNTLLLIASYLFYGWWDYRFLTLIAFSSIVDYLVGRSLGREKDQKKRKSLLAISILVNLGFLGFFKYYNFFTESFVDAFSILGQDFSVDRLNIILPVGISFYTFQTLSYSIDVYRRKLEPAKDVISFFTFVSFFPQLVAGPIERATNLLPQFYKKRHFDVSKATDGLRQILWGFFKKMVIADNCAIFVNEIFSNYEIHSGATLFAAGVFFAFQIYCDFSGYSDIAIGTSRLFGFSLKQNFAFPYFSRDIAEFWRRWHISLSTWFRDYLYIPLGGSRGGIVQKIRNTFIIFIVSGFWHGANWTFIIWGFLNALYFLPLLLAKKNRSNLDVVAKGKVFIGLKDLFKMGITFFLTIIAWIFFRAKSVGQAFNYLKEMFQADLFQFPYVPSKLFLLILLGFVMVEWFQRDKQHGLELDPSKIKKTIRWSAYVGIILVIITFGEFNETEFIYFAF